MISRISQENAIAAVVLMMSIILLKPQCVKWSHDIKNAIPGACTKGMDK